MEPKLFKVVASHPDRKTCQKRLEAPQDASGYYTREVDGEGTITYRKVKMP